MKIIVNAREVEWLENLITYEDLVFLAHRNEKKHYTATYYWNYGISYMGASILPGQGMIPKENMVFNVHDTSNA